MAYPTPSTSSAHKRKFPFNDDCKTGAAIGCWPILTHYRPYEISERNVILVKKFLLANGIQTTDEEVAKNLLLERDHQVMEFSIFVLFIIKYLNSTY